jgi:hypothetical protein
MRYYPHFILPMCSSRGFVEEDLTLGHLEVRVAHDRVRERGLAGAVGAHQRVELTRTDVQVDPLEDLLVRGVDVQVLDLKLGH